MQVFGWESCRSCPCVRGGSKEVSCEVAGGDVVVGMDVNMSIVEAGGLLAAIAALRCTATCGAGTEGSEAMIMPPTTSVFIRKRCGKKRVVRVVSAPGNVVDCVIYCDNNGAQKCESSM